MCRLEYGSISIDVPNLLFKPSKASKGSHDPSLILNDLQLGRGRKGLQYLSEEVQAALLCFGGIIVSNLTETLASKIRL